MEIGRFPILATVGILIGGLLTNLHRTMNEPQTTATLISLQNRPRFPRPQTLEISFLSLFQINLGVEFRQIAQAFCLN